jgi:hypothetical protein
LVIGGIVDTTNNQCVLNNVYVDATNNQCVLNNVYFDATNKQTLVIGGININII